MDNKAKLQAGLSVNCRPPSRYQRIGGVMMAEKLQIILNALSVFIQTKNVIAIEFKESHV